jgi:DNA-binding Lrp family transcriptional regulator
MQKRLTFDRINKFLIAELQKDGRVKLTKLAKKLGITPAAVKERIERLIDRQVIKVFALINPDNINNPDFYYPISATLGIEADSECVSILTKRFRNCPLVITLHKTSGMHNLTMTLLGRDLESLEKRISDHIRNEPGIKHVEVNVGNSTFKDQFIPLKIAYPIKNAAPCGVGKEDETRCEDCPAFIGEE